MLEDPKSARVKGVSILQQKDARLETGLFLLEGPQGLKELIKTPEIVQEVFATAEALDRYPFEFEDLDAAGVSVIEVSERVMAALSDTKTPQGVIAVVEQLDVNLAAVIANKPKLIAFLDQARDPGNAGTVIRAADAAGADAVLLSKDSVDVYNPKVVRSTAGSIFHLATVINQDSVTAISALKAAGIQVFAADAGGVPITDISQEVLAQPTAWVFGNEAHGVSQEVLDLADKIVALPIYGEAESLNLATAASVCLYASAFAMQANH
ncbi:MAG: RNA methyltransferase [Aquiluna sp.]|nr:RNA methyltransferase [Aquiluna sp.]MCF8545996.1 RNA methyltransferase [Aquiluna sp.]